MRTKIFCGLFFFFLVVSMPIVGHGNTNTREYCEQLIESVKQEYSQKNFAKCIELLTEVKDLAKTNKWPDIEAQALNNLGVLYQRISDYDKAMECYLAVYKMIGDRQEEKHRKAIVLNNIAGLYATDKEFNKATDYYQKALLISRQVKDTISMMHILNNLGAIANETNNTDLAIQHANSSLDLSQNIPTDRMINSLEIKANALYLRREYDAAGKLALSTFQQMQIYEIDYPYTVSLILLISKIFQEQGKGQEAIFFVKKALDYSSNLKDFIDIYEQMAILYQKNHFSDLALAYKDSVSILKDSLHKINAFDNIENGRIRFELLNSEKELAENKAKQKVERMLFIVVVISIFILALIFIWVLRIQSIRSKQWKIIIEKEQQITKLELETEKNQKMIIEQRLKEKETASLLEQERLHNEINIKNKQLTAKILSQTNNNELIKNLIKELIEASASKENPMLDAIIRKLKMQLNNSLEWDSFLTYFEQINPTLLESLQRIHPNLPVNNMQLLSCIYLNLDTKKIAYLLNISSEACRKKKQRLANKMNIPVAELSDYIAKIAKASL